MANDTTFSSGDVLPSAFVNRQQAVESASAWGIRLIKLNSTTVRVPVADEGNGTTQSGIRIGGKPRYVTSPVDIVISGGAATFKVCLTAGAGPGFTGVFTSGAVPADSRQIGTVVWDGSAITEVRQHVDAVSGHGYAHRYGGEDSVAPEFVTALPALPFDGQEIYYAADVANGVIWRLRYRAAASGSFKWEFVGGGPLMASVATNQVPGGASYADLATVGPSITVPLSGDYEIVLSVTGAASSGTGWAAVQFGAAAAVDADGIQLVASAAGNIAAQMSRPMRRNVGSASMVVKVVYRTVAGTFSFNNRELLIRPIRVG